MSFRRHPFLDGTDIIGILDNSGNIVVKYKYDAYGNCTRGYTTNNDLADSNPIRYRGYYYDKETGLYYLNARYYNPEWRRFISPDSTNYLDPETPNGLNLYAYCHNDPVNYADPSGHFVLSSFLIGLGIASAIGAGIGAASYVVSQGINYAVTGNWEWSWGGFLSSTIGGAAGGIATYVLGPNAGLALSSFVGGFTSNVVTMAMENAIFDSKYAMADVLISSMIVGGLSIVSAGIMNKIRITGLNAGRGNYSSISNQIYTKFYRGHIGRIKFRTFGKMVVSEAYSNIAEFFIDEAYSKIGIKDMVLAWN